MTLSVADKVKNSPKIPAKGKPQQLIGALGTEGVTWSMNRMDPSKVLLVVAVLSRLPVDVAAKAGRSINGRHRAGQTLPAVLSDYEVIRMEPAGVKVQVRSARL